MDTRSAPDTFTMMLHAIDGRDWATVRRAFADRIDLDYTSLFGVPAAIVDGDEHVAGWKAFAAAFDATQHVTGPFVAAPDGDAVIAHTHVRAYHQIKRLPGGEIWMVAGHYRIRLVPTGGAWKIAALTLQVFYQEGNLAIPDVARSRAG